MQWLFDIVLAMVANAGYALQSWVQAQGYLTTGFVNRGDPNVVDYDKNDFIKDAAWHTLDISAIVPAGAKAVALSVLLTGPTVAKGFWFARNGQAFGRNAFRGSLVVANLLHIYDGVVAVDTDRKIQYLFHVSAFTQIDVTVKCWWL